MSAFHFDIKINAGKRKLVDIDGFEISPNKITFLFGESGIGKSIISKAFYGLLDGDDLKIKINDFDYPEYLKKDLVTEQKDTGFFVFQEPSSHLNPLRKLAVQLNEGSLKNINKKDEQAIIKFLWDGGDQVFLEKLLQVFPKPYRPSGGEKQRILLAMAFKKIKKYIDDKSQTKTALFVFDEPTGSLDNRFRNLFLQLLIECYRQKPFSALIITHDYSIISEMETHYPDLQKAIEYKELNRIQGKLKLDLFSKKAYLDWVKNQDKLSVVYDNNKNVLILKSPVSVFDRNLAFYKKGKDGQFSRTDLELRKNNLVYLKAQSGVGKTTIAKIIMGLVKPEKMQISYGSLNADQNTGEEVWRKSIWGQYVSMVFQHADESLNQNASVIEAFNSLPLKKPMDQTQLTAQLQTFFDEKINPTFLQKKIKFLSGGQKQRLNILRSMLLETDVLIMDEPLNGLDLKSVHKVIGKIKLRQQQGAAILLISHNEEIFDNMVSEENVIYLKIESK